MRKILLYSGLLIIGLVFSQGQPDPAHDLAAAGGRPTAPFLKPVNGATHDAAIAAWGAKGHYDYARPISMIRYMGGLGQSSDPDGPAYHPDGLPLRPGRGTGRSCRGSVPGSPRRAGRAPRRAARSRP